MSTSTSASTDVRQELNRLFLLESGITEDEFANLLAYITNNPNKKSDIEENLKYGTNKVKIKYLRKLLESEQPASGPPSKRLKISDENLIEFWQALTNATYSDGFLELSEGTRFLGKENGPSVLYIRKCYLDLKVTVFNENIRKLRITGNPGIGKTYFGYYLLYLLAMDGEIIVYDNANEPKPIYFEGENADKVSKDEAEVYTRNPNVWYIVDGKDPDDVNAKTILICSPKKVHYQRFEKYVGNTTRFMPIWKWKEIKTCREVLYYGMLSEKKVKPLFSKWGGIPRFVLENANDPTHQDKLESAIASVKEAMFDYIGEKILEADDVSHKIAHIHVNLPADDDNDDSDNNDGNQSSQQLQSSSRRFDRDGNEPYTRSIVRFASEHVRQRVVEQYETRIKEKIRAEIKAGIGNSLLGSSFEYFAHRILRNGGQFDVRPLNSYVDPKYKDSRANVKIPKQDKILKFSRNSINSIEEGKYYEPKEKNFPSIDSIIAPNRAFQMTITKDHPIKTLGLDLLCDKLGGKSSKKFIYFYFVVPAHLYDDFKLQRIDAKKIPGWINQRIFQYVLKIQL